MTGQDARERRKRTIQESGKLVAGKRGSSGKPRSPKRQPADQHIEATRDNQDNQQEPCNWSWLLVHCWVLSEHELNSWCSDSKTSNAVLNDCKAAGLQNRARFPPPGNVRDLLPEPTSVKATWTTLCI